MHIPQTEVILRHQGTELARVTLPPGEYVIGRNPDVEIHAGTPLISRRHAQLTINYDNLLIEDLGSSNGTFVNEQPITETTRLFPNQAVRLGDITVEIHRQRAPSEPGVSLAPAQATLRRFLPDELLGDKRYAIGGIVAQGGMGAILNARQNAIERTVAMKIMLDSAGEADVLRFLDEAKITGQLEHPNIVPVHELGVDEQDQLFYTMKMVRGITLRKVLDLMAEGVEATVRKYPLPALLTIFQKVCDALAFAHSKGVIHRDLKPENIMLDDFGVVLVMDWGLAKVVGQTNTPAVASFRSVVMSARAAEPEFGSTLAGTIMGTPQYMSPEQARGEVETLDARSDIYALGAILFHLLALRPSVSGPTAMHIVDKVARGEIEPLFSPQRHKDTKQTKDPASFVSSSLRGHLPGGRIPDSLAAVVRKAMALAPAARYRSVEDLQADLLAYQSGFATSAEQAGWWKRVGLALKRNKAASLGAAAVLLIGSVLGTQAVLEGRRATKAITELKKSAPALLQLAESEAGSQRFASALGKLDAALALDPALLRARWQRAWVFLGLERWSEAADALRLARQHDPAGAQLVSILPAVEKVAAAPEAGRWKSDAAREVFAHLQSVEATGPALAFSGKLKLGAAERAKLADQRLLTMFGKGNYSITVKSDGLVEVDVSRKPLRSLEAIRGLPIEILKVFGTLIADLEPLRGMRLNGLWNGSNNVADLTPLTGMPLRFLQMTSNPVRDLSPLAGMPLTVLDLGITPVTRIDALRGMPLVDLKLGGTNVVDCSPLRGTPLQLLQINDTKISDLSFLQGMPLRSLNLETTRVSNIAALRGLPLENLNLKNTPISDISPLQGAGLKELNLRLCKKLTDYTPVLTLTRLEVLHCDVLPAALLPLRESATLQSIEADAYPGEAAQGARPVAEFWRAYDAHQAVGKK